MNNNTTLKVSLLKYPERVLKVVRDEMDLIKRNASCYIAL